MLKPIVPSFGFNKRPKLFHDGIMFWLVFNKIFPLLAVLGNKTLVRLSIGFWISSIGTIDGSIDGESDNEGDTDIEPLADAEAE